MRPLLVSIKDDLGNSLKTDPRVRYCMNPSFTQLFRLHREQQASEQLGKVAAVTLSFWIAKTLLTTVGDVSGDLLSTTLGLGYVTSLVVASAFVLALLVAQLRAARFSPLVYWLLILGTSTIGTELSDTMDRALHLGYTVGTGVFLLCLLGTVAVWQLRRGTVAVYPVYQAEEQLFYWTAAVFANSLGSVLGDLIGDRLGLGIAAGISINVGVIGAFLLLHYATRVNKALVFWGAFVFTRA
ncbi:MAG: hypothetical protein P8180_10130 [Gammaproteobacteria bacterium]|jgi:uncharacterized membrane-anchored protein